MFVIMGATGQVGGAVLEGLKGRSVAVRAVARASSRATPHGVEVVRADASDQPALAAAFAGAKAAFVMVVPPPEAEDVLAAARASAHAIASAVRAARVPHVVALSSQGAHLADGNGVVRALHDFETALAGSAPSLVLLRPGNFMENWAAVLPVAREAGVLPSALLPLGQKSETVSALDVGRTAADLLFDPRPGTRIVNLAGPAEYSAMDAAAALSTLLGKGVTAVPSSRDETIAGLLAAGLGADYAARLADLNDAINTGRMGVPVGSGEMQRGTTTLEQALRRLVEAAP